MTAAVDLGIKPCPFCGHEIDVERNIRYWHCDKRSVKRQMVMSEEDRL